MPDASSGSGRQSNKRLKKGISDPEPPPGSLLLSKDDVNCMLSEVEKHRADLLHLLSNEKDANCKKKLREALNAYADIMIKLCSAYLCRITADEVASASKKVIEDASAKLEHTCTALNSACTALNSAASGLGAQRASTYAGAVADHRDRRSAAGRVSLTTGKSFNVPKRERIIIGPTDSAKNRYTSSSVTKDALVKCIDPSRLKIGVSRLRYGPLNSVIIEGDCLSAEKFSGCTGLSDAGLEIKRDAKLMPRVVVHDIPVDYTSDSICESIAAQNLPEATSADLKMVYLYPAGTKKHRSCIIELKPEFRAILMNRKRVNIGWMSCRIDDHINVLQCFKCNGFNHTKDNCEETAPTCGKCAGTHLSSECTESSVLHCINCEKAGSTNVEHAATDKSKCPILRKKVEHRISQIDYGEL
ncbi:uncharacterized protein LOC106653938 [Trichogramma pretiosum]|uniref:uncharacterized protein LOC106653938 n=1 Tax=Trichogramma pretiosum TaxID=7493 RepID=UPI0006C9AC61|nr:uncharacterized protein LOC106653938 [Trichogramma pretiosum]